MQENRRELLNKFISGGAIRNLYFSHATGRKRINENTRLIMILSGQITLTLFDGTEYYNRLCRSGDAVFCLEGGYSDIVYDHEYESAALVFIPDHIRMVYYKYTKDQTHPLHTPALYYLSTRPPDMVLLNMINAMNLLQAESEPAARGSIQLAEAIKAYTIHMLRIPENEHSGRAFQTWQKINQYIIAHPEKQNYRYILAKQFKLTPGHISTLCRTFTGRTLNGYMMTLRLQQATLLLQETHLTLDEIAERCGFNYTSYLIRIYRKHYGCTPGEMRR